MCGIFGAYSLDRGRALPAYPVTAALAEIHHRGPDARQHVEFSCGALLGHTRLSIIDLGEQSKQPMMFADRYWVVFNGEIYNYVELREELKAAGATFRSSGDTEVLIQAYAMWGHNCVSRFNGMWSFAIYDTVEHTLFCSRDRFGEKPFNYAMVDGRLLFASEIKSLLACHPELAEPNYNVISNFCRTSVGAQHPDTWFKRVKRLQPGHNMFVRDKQVSIERYWQYPTRRDTTVSFAAACEQYRHLFLESVAVRMRSDVPLGLTLSSGLDSTSIAYAMRRTSSAPFNSFTATFDSSDELSTDGRIFRSGDDPIDESTVAERVAKELGFNAHVLTTRYDDIVASLSRIVRHLESGNSSPAVIPLFQLFEYTRQHVTVVLEGQGADELLGGYIGTLLVPALLDRVLSGHPLEAARFMREFSSTYKIGYAVKLALREMSNNVDILSRMHQKHHGIDTVFGPLLKSYSRMKDYPNLAGGENLTMLMRALRRQHSGGLVNLLHYGDAISMANSLESRLPFLDYRLVEFVWSLPEDFKLRNGRGKYLQREAMRGLVPDDILDEKRKFGFNTPIGRQFMGQSKFSEDPVGVLLSKRALDRGLFDPTGLKRLIDVHQAGEDDHGPLLFRLLSVELWFREFIDKPAQSLGEQSRPLH